MNFLDLLFIPLLILLGHGIINITITRFKAPEIKRVLVTLLYYHFFFSLVYAWYVSTFGGDSIGYWQGTSHFGFRDGAPWFTLHQTGTPYIFFLTYPFAEVLGLNFITGSLLFSLFGFTGFVFLVLTVRRTIHSNVTLFGYRLLPFIFFLPNMHFWSGGIGKDTIMFFALSLFIFSLTKPAKNIVGILLSFYLAYYIRPHIAMLMVVGLGFALVTSTKGLSFFWRVSLLALSVYIFVLISPSVFEFIGLESESLEEIEDISAIKSKLLSRSQVGSAIDISNYSTSAKILTFFYRPFFIDSPNAFGFLASLENLFYVLLTLAAMRWRTLPELITLPLHLKAALMVLGSAAFFMSSSLSNLGIIIRQKNMVMFMLVLICVYLIHVHQAAGRSVATKRATKLHTPDNKHEKAIA
jgi:hypothetical protein